MQTLALNQSIHILSNNRLINRYYVVQQCKSIPRGKIVSLRVRSEKENEMYAKCSAIL
jgi:hypothetical protein